ncbi:MAG: putative porin [Alteromonadaceae bacterium]|jgi:predicted porin
MKLSNRCTTFAILSTMSLSTLAANVDIYGKANVSVQSSDDGKGSYSEIKSNASRIGFKGNYALDNDLEVIFKAEFQVDIDGDSEKGKSITDRNQYLGLRGNFGEVLIGINDTVLKQSQGKVDLFNDLNADIKNLWKGENRLSDNITYKTPTMSGFQLGVTYIAEDSIDGEDAFSVAATFGDAKLKKSKIFASIAMDSEVAGYDVKRGTVQGKVAGFTLGLIVQTQEKIDGSAEMDGYMASIKYVMNKITLKGQYQMADFKDSADKSGVSIGADYKLGETTKLYSFYTNFDIKDSPDKEYLGIGLEYKF